MDTKIQTKIEVEITFFIKTVFSPYDSDKKLIFPDVYMIDLNGIKNLAGKT